MYILKQSKGFRESFTESHRTRIKIKLREIIYEQNQGVGPILSKIDVIKKIDAPIKVHGVWRLVGIEDYHMGIWRKRAYMNVLINSSLNRLT